VVVNIDETGRDNQASRLNDFFVCSCDKLSDFCDAVADESNVCKKGLAAAAVDYKGANDDMRFCGLGDDGLGDECSAASVEGWEAGKPRKKDCQASKACYDARPCFRR
jgi:hypothetical protein